jgi:hypothetical protein
MTTKTTMHDKLMRLLRRKWMTPLSALQEAQCLSLAQRVSSWRKAGIKIDKKWVDLPSGKRVRAYRIPG